MRKLAYWLTTTLVSIVFLNGCSNKDVLSKGVDVRQKEVMSWLESTKAFTKGIGVRNVETLSNNLQFDKAFVDNLNASEHILIIPVSENFKRAKNIKTASNYYLVLTRDNLNNIKRGYVCDYLPKSNDQLQKGSLGNIFQNKLSDVNGRLRFLQTSGKFIYELGVENGKINSMGNLVAGGIKNQTKVHASNTTCIDWYIVTTFYVDGVQVDQWEEYVGTTCRNDDCQDPNYEMVCPGDGGGGSYPSCCIDPNAQVSVESADEDKTVTCGSFYMNNNTNNMEMECVRVKLSDVVYLSGYIKFYDANYRGFKESTGQYDFKWRLVDLESITSSGTLPVCISFTSQIRGKLVDYGDDRKLATIKYDHVLTGTFDCLSAEFGYQVIKHNANWSAN